MADVIKKTFLQAIQLERDKISNFKPYPFCIPAVRHLHRLEFHPAVTFFIGENGTGKSTLMEAIAMKYGFNAEGGSKNFNFATQDTGALKMVGRLGFAPSSRRLRARLHYQRLP
jgi:predicted ATPase